MVADIGAEIAELKLIYLFGSHAEGYIGPLSDYDFGVLLKRKNGTSEYRSLLYSNFAKKLSTDLIDVILLNNAPIELAFHVISYGELLYESDAESRIEYESNVMGLYFDYLPILRAQRHDILKGGEHAIRIPPGNRLEKFSGDLAGFYSIRINDQFRIIFKWINDHAYEVQLIDYH